MLEHEKKTMLTEDEYISIVMLMVSMHRCRFKPIIILIPRIFQ